MAENDHVQRFTSAQAIQKATLDYFSLFLSEPTAEVASRLVKQVLCMCNVHVLCTCNVNA